MSQNSVALLSWGGQPDRVIQDVEWVLDDREDSTNQLRATTTLAEADGVEDEQELIFQNRRFIVSGVERDRHTDRATIVADEAQVELAGHVLTDFEFNSWTAFQALDHALKDTRWTPGEVANVRFGRAQFEDLTVLEACHFLANHQDAYVTFDSLRRRVNITVQRGVLHERVFTYGRELENIEKESRQPETTVIYPTGADDLTIEHVNNGRDYVEDYGYYTSRGVSLADARKWYRKEDHWSDSRYEYASNMKRDAEKRLADEAYPAITYTLTAQVTTASDGTDDDLDLTGIGLGDTVYVWDDEIDAKLMADVSAITTSSDQSRNELVLSTLPESFGGTTRRGSGRYFGDSGSTAGDHPLFPRSGFQPRPSMPILENVTDVGVGTVRWNGQDHDGNYTTIPVRFGSVVPVVAKVAEDGSIPSPGSDVAYEGGPIHSRGGGLSTVAFGSPGEFAVWFYMLGQDGRTRSEYSEPLMVTVEALVNVQDIEAGLQETRQRIQDAADEAEQRFQDYDQRQDQFEASIGDARTRLSEAESRLTATESTVAEARDFAEGAIEAAEAAEARAVEASNNASNRLQNGGFELGLDHWEATSVELSDDAHTGNHAALIGVGGALHPDASIPVAEGAVWDVSAYAKNGDALVIEFINDTTGDALQTFTIPTNSMWSETGRLRTEVPADVSYLNIRLTGDGVLVDDVVLRDVTDVVRLERAAQQARDHADQALDRVGDMEFSLNGVEQKLADAQAELQQKVDASRLHELDAKLAAFQGRYSRVWHRATPPPSGTTYEWTDGAHMSPSVQREDGVIVGRNLSFNPSFETGTHNVNTGSATSATRTTFANAVLTGEYGLAVRLQGASTASGYVQQQVDLSYAQGQYVAVGTSARKSGSGGPNYARLYASWPGSSGSAEYMSDGYELTQVPMKEAPRMAGVVRIPNDAATANLWLRFFDRADGGAPADGLVHTDGWLIVTGATRQGALDRLQGFYDGDTPDDRQNDLWYDAEGVPHFWLKGWGWAVLEDERLDALTEDLVAAAQVAQSAQATADQAQADADAAAQAALDAAGIAGARGGVIPSATEPTGQYARPEYLWVDVTTSKVHAHVNGQWTEVTDPGIAQAAQAAATAQLTAEQAAQAASSAHQAAGEAHSHATAAMNRAGAAETNAKNHANELPKVLHGTGLPAGEAPDGSIWWQHQDELTGPVIGQWNRVDGAWVSTPIDSEAIANLDVGKLTAGAAEISEAVIEKLWVDVVRAGLVEADEALIGEVLIKEDSITVGKLTGLEEIATALVEADKARFVDLFAADLLANNAELVSAAIKNLDVTEKANLVDAMAEQLYADQFVARVATLGRAIIAAPNLIPHWSQINERVPDGFEGFSYNPNDPSMYVANSNVVNQSTRMHLVAGEPYVFSVDARSTFSYNTYTIALYSGELGFVGFFASFEAPGTSFSTLEHDFTVEETRDDYYLQFRPMREIESGFQWFRNLNIQHALDGRLIVPDTIETRHLRVTEDMTAALLRAKKVEAGDIDANAINGMTIEGGIVKGGRVEGAALIGGRVDVGPRYTINGNRGISLSENGVFRMYDSLGELSTIIDGVNNRFTGRVSTARPGSPGLILEPASSNANRPGIFMSPDGQASGNHGGVFTDNLWRLVLRGRRTSWDQERNRILVEGGFYITEGRFTSDVEATFTKGLGISGPDRFKSYSSAEFHNLIEYPGAPNSSLPSNVNLGGSGISGQYLRRTSSVRKTKVNIETVSPLIWKRILQLELRDWYDRHDLEQALGEEHKHHIQDHEPGVGPTIDQGTMSDILGERIRRVPGLVAEEVIDARLEDFVTYHTNEDTGEEELSSVAYDRLWTLLIPIAKEHEDKISDLEDTVADLTARLETLENQQ